jgi:hypothetical protein
MLKPAHTNHRRVATARIALAALLNEEMGA